MKKYDEDKQYIKSLSETEKLTLEIARQQLGSSFNLRKSNGFIQWKNEKQKSAKNN